MTAMDLKCRICGGAAGERHVACEMMYGSREAFGYFECAECGTLQIEAVPGDLARYYPSGYYSLDGTLPKQPSLKRRLAAAWAYSRDGGLAGWLCHALKPNPEMRLLGELGIAKDDAILDVGCGRGARVARLRQFGFARAEGIDPHLDQDIEMHGRKIARRARLEDVRGLYRLVMFHHSFEHLPDPHAALEAARALLAPDGRILIRVPTCSSQAWTDYGTDWVQLDPPRHLFLFSRDGFRRLAAAHGLKIDRIDDDSDAFQFWGSEQYRRGIAMNDPRAHSRKTPLFDAAQIAAWDAEAKKLNEAGRGDQFAAVLSRA
ncbi:MAG: class I SAM-dependent methyltransferase [Rhodospirillales bacterium]|nr:class I SAM-dependent methyltransferase [Rhodospirillales bacterium]